MNDHLKGSLLCLIGIIILSPDSLMVLTMSETLPTSAVICYRYGLNAIFGLCAYVCICRYENKAFMSGFQSNGKVGLGAGLLFSIAHVTITYAFIGANTATVLVILAAGPIFSACSAYLLLGEIPLVRTVVTGAVAMGALVYICVDELVNSPSAKNEDEEASRSVLGILAALLSSISFGMYLTVLRYLALKKQKKAKLQLESAEVQGRACMDRDSEVINNRRPAAVDTEGVRGLMQVLPCDIIAATCASFFAGCFVIAESGDGSRGGFDTVGLTSGVVLLVNGAVILPLSFTLLTLGPALISAPEVSLYMLLETVLGPVWVWLAGYDSPTFAGLVGGGILIAAMACNSGLAIRDSIKAESAVPKEKDAGHIEVLTGTCA